LRNQPVRGGCANDFVCTLETRRGDGARGGLDRRGRLQSAGREDADRRRAGKRAIARASTRHVELEQLDHRTRHCEPGHGLDGAGFTDRAVETLTR
jgi:hypothetical protein